MVQLTIKQKIALGFGSIGILLVIGSSFFYRSLAHIQTANTNIATVAVPVQNYSNELQVTLLQLAKTGSLAFSLSDLNQIQTSYQQFKALDKTYQQLNLQLTDKVSHRPQMKASLAAANNAYQQYSQQSNALFNAKLAIETTKAAFNTLENEFITARNNASNNTIDLEMLQVPNEDLQLLEEVTGTGIRIDDALYTLGNTMLELPRLTSLAELKSHQQDVAIILSNISTYSVYIKQQAATLPAKALLEDLDSNLTKINTLLAEPATLYRAQEAVINQQQLAQTNYLAANKSLEISNQALEQIVIMANGRFTELMQLADDEVLTAQTLAVSMAVIFIVMACLIYFFTSKAMLGPLTAVNRALSRIASGDLSKRLTKRNEDEFGLLMDNINKLSDDLALLLKNIHKDAILLDKSATQSQKQGQQIARSADNQIQQIEQAKQLAEHIHHSSDTVNSQVFDAEEQIKRASEQSGQVKVIANTNRERIETLSTSLYDSVGIMSSLSNHSDNIGGILVTISAIAEQTNLLALNAAIEAARAGEHGRGFAVVADEVRSLASRTQSSTSEIQTMISALQHETQNAVSAISQGQQQAKDCVSQSQSLNDAIEQIEQALTTISSMSQRISQASNEQLNYSEKIEATMAETTETAQQNATESSEMAMRSEELNQLAHSLSTSVERFKL
ncbi:methyl-accepting chemotaxis protein [Shewanella olleyana]|uniref:methyl-accepting chemotaxis protein n=1 Tax=Shewanella olleyana TaxID=135626 RepID=UPI00200C9A76|nr:methyl-accepting chemotaxis protein [Shewanella olleyana]MCL1067063.1 methyl-accepting chemotaxis protein [Shewanella olleyana]